MEEILEKKMVDLLIDKSDWGLTKFGNVSIQQKKTVDREDTELTNYVKGEHMGSEDLHLRSWGELKDEYLGPAFIRKFAKGNILYGSRRTYLRKVVIAPFSGITSNTTFVIKANEKKIDPRLLPFIMLSEGFAQNSIRNSKGSVNPYINWRDIANYEFLLPPMDKQTQLADLLCAMDEAIEVDLILIKELNTFKQTFFIREVKQREGKKMPLSDILIPKKEKSHFPHKRKRYIGLEHIDSGAFKCSKFGESSLAKAQGNLIDKGDLCYSKLRPYLDKAFIADFDAVSTTELLVYDTQIASKEYILNHFHSPAFLTYISDKGFGTKMPRVNQKIIGEFIVKVLNEEDQFLEELDRIGTATENIQDKIRSAKNLQKSLINQIF